MIPRHTYVSILANLCNHAPVDLDADIFDGPEMGGPGHPAPLPFPPCPALWDMKDPALSRIGLRIRAPVENPDFLAARLAAIALERHIHPIFLSYVGPCGMQRFGFRVEQLSGLPPEAQEQFEAQLKRFWQLAMVIDASELSTLR